MFSRLQSAAQRFGRLELALLAAMLVLLAQISPDTTRQLCGGFSDMLDVRNWSVATRIFANVALITALLAYRFLPEIVAAFSTQTSTRRRSLKRRRIQSNLHPDEDYQQRLQRDREWAERAKKRLPFQ